MQIDFVAKSLGYEIDTQFADWNYNVGHDRAIEIWKRYRDYYAQFDVIITSDTAPLSRIFLQNGFNGKLIIWCCNRFDYHDATTNDCVFPDKEYYDLFRAATKQSNVKVIPNTIFEYEYARRYRNVEIGTNVIRPCSFVMGEDATILPSSIDNPENTFYISQYHNHSLFMNLKSKCDELGLTSYYGHYNSLSDLKNIKGIINIPYAYSTIALFENWSMGNVYIIPSRSFLLQLSKLSNFWWQNIFALPQLIDTSEWYLPEHKNLFIYFDSWSHLKTVAQDVDLINAVKQNVMLFSQKHNLKTLNQWQKAIMQW